MTETYVSYTPGQSTLLARNGCFLLIATTPTHPAIGQLWTALGATDAPDVLRTAAELLPKVPFSMIVVSDHEVALAGRDLPTVLDGRSLELDAELSPVAIPGYGGILMSSAPGVGASRQQLSFEAGVVGAEAVMVVQVGDVSPGSGPRPAAPVTALWEDVPALEEPVATAELVDVPAPLETPLADVPALADLPAPLPETAWGMSRPPLDDPTVLAAYCLQGHLGPAAAPECRTCGATMPQQTPARIERPVLGTLILTDGREFALDRDAVLGRAPRVPDGATNEPHLVNLAPFGRDISRQHAEVVAQDWDIAVRDLGSVNGTRVVHPSGESVVAEPGALIPLQPGSQIEVAEVATLTYQVSGQTGPVQDQVF